MGHRRNIKIQISSFIFSQALKSPQQIMSCWKLICQESLPSHTYSLSPQILE